MRLLGVELFIDLDDFSVVHASDAVGVGEDPVVVGDDDDGALGRAGDLTEEFEDDLAVLGIERGGRLVADDKRRLVDEGTGDGDALLFAAGEFVRSFFPAGAEADFFEDFPRANECLAAGNALDEQGNADVFCDGEGGDEIELLENEADAFGTEAGERVA